MLLLLLRGIMQFRCSRCLPKAILCLTAAFVLLARQGMSNATAKSPKWKHHKCLNVAFRWSRRGLTIWFTKKCELYARFWYFDYRLCSVWWSIILAAFPKNGKIRGKRIGPKIKFTDQKFWQREESQNSIVTSQKTPPSSSRVENLINIPQSQTTTLGLDLWICK